MTKDSWSIEDPIQVEEAGKKITMAQLKNEIHFVKGWRGLVEVIGRYKEAGAEAVVLISEANRSMIKEIGKNVLEVF